MVLEDNQPATAGLTDLELAAAEVIQDLRALYRVVRGIYRTGEWSQDELGSALWRAAYQLGEDYEQFE